MRLTLLAAAVSAAKATASPTAIEQFFMPLLPIKRLWEAVFVGNLSWGLSSLTHAFGQVPVLASIGAYGLAIVVLTLGIKLILAPLFHFQISTSKKTIDDQRRLAPELRAIKAKFKGDPAKTQEETMKLYKEHGVNPLASVAGCLPALAQFPIWVGLYWVLRDNVNNHVFKTAQFFFIPNLNLTPMTQHLAGSLIPSVAYLIIPLLAGGTAYVQAKMMQQPPNPGATEQELQTQQMGKTMVMIMPFTIGFFALQSPAGLGLYWFVSNCVAIVQQYLVVGIGGFRKPDEASGGPTKSASPGPRPAPRPSKPSNSNRSSKRSKR
jgi:YidC/Oxa1 family membrane protein insertase